MGGGCPRTGGAGARGCAHKGDAHTRGGGTNTQTHTHTETRKEDAHAAGMQVPEGCARTHTHTHSHKQGGCSHTVRGHRRGGRACQQGEGEAVVDPDSRYEAEISGQPLPPAGLVTATVHGMGAVGMPWGVSAGALGARQPMAACCPPRGLLAAVRLSPVLGWWQGQRSRHGWLWAAGPLRLLLGDVGSQDQL